MQDLDFNEIIGLICKEDPRYDRKAYVFLREGLDHAVRELKKRDTERAKSSLHITGEELLMGLRAYALDQYGPLAMTVLDSWGVRRCGDFGDMVFNLIEYNVFSKTDQDKREDFTEVYTFADAFVKPFLPQTPRKPGVSQISRIESR